MGYSHIAFDIDGTLIDTEFAVLHSLQKTLMILSGKEIPLKELTFALGITGADAMKILGIEDTSAALDLWDKNMRGYEDTVTVFDGMEELAEALSAKGLELGIITSKTRESFNHDFCRFGISRHFHTVVCADDTGRHKPNPEPLLKFMELSGADRRNVLYIGDSRYDSQCAESACVDFALAVWGSHSRAVRADYYLDKPAGLLSAIRDDGRQVDRPMPPVL